jgi:peptidyl-prolyl cis-trans isomerase B (cyclophilin B)
LWGQRSPKVKISTVYSDLIVLLYIYNDTPNHKDNFISIVKAGNYNGTLFHRVISGFMIQGGDLNSIGASPTQSLGVDNCPQVPNEI